MGIGAVLPLLKLTAMGQRIHVMLSAISLAESGYLGDVPRGMPERIILITLTGARRMTTVGRTILWAADPGLYKVKTAS